MNEGKHLTTEGLDLIRTIKNKMNSCRWEATSKGTKRKYNNN
jgi:hypothetical protein